MRETPITSVQGEGLHSPMAGRRVRVRGVVTGRTRKGFFIQDPEADPEAAASCGLFVFSPRGKPADGAEVTVEGEVVDYAAEENDRPTTQIASAEVRVVAEQGPPVPTVWLTADRLRRDDAELAAYLNGLEGMRVGVEPGAVFIAPSNPFGDYVVLPPGAEHGARRSRQGGVLVDRARPHRWYPSFRLLDYARAPKVNVGAVLLDPVVGPLNYRSASFQIAVKDPFRVRDVPVRRSPATLDSDAEHLTVLTLNGFNLDARLEDPARVKDPRRDVDDDLADGRYRMLAEAIVRRAGAPDVVALQEIQDDDGAEITPVVTAERNFQHLIEAVLAHKGPRYRWADIPPRPGADGGQPGGNIRNAFLYDPRRVELVPDSLRRLGDGAPAFEGSRKPLCAVFRRPGLRELAVINVHLASKRHQFGLFAPRDAGFDPRAELRAEQARLVAAEAAEFEAAGVDVYITGDFNDFEFSPTLEALLSEDRRNLVDGIPADERHDYNHRGLSQVLMHGVASAGLAARSGTGYEILHGNELAGVQPGELGDKPTDHAYVLARLAPGPPG